MSARDDTTVVRLAELVATLSLATDLGLGQPMEHCLRQTMIALRLADRVGLDDDDRAVTYYVGLLAWVCCHADSYEQAQWFGDDIAMRAGTYDYDMAGLPFTGYLLRRVGAGRGPVGRGGRRGAFVTGGLKEAEAFDMTHCVLASTFAAQLEIGRPVCDALLQAYERWDGKGAPASLAGEQLAVPVRLVQLADVVEVYYRLGGLDAAREVARKRSAKQFDPSLVELFCDQAPEILGGIEAASGWDAVIEAEPTLARTVAGLELDRALEAMGDLADLKTPYTAGHSRGVANLAAEAARISGVPDGEVTALRRAGLLHDLGRLGVSNAVWDKPGALGTAELERVRLHPYLTDRMLRCSSALAPLAELASRHHERLDGSGYPRGLGANELGPLDRILAAADAYHAMTEPRPHRTERSPDDAALELRSDVRAGRLDGNAVNAVLKAAGHRVRARREWPAGLTAREVEVLALLARGHPNKVIAQRLSVTPKTVANHVEHIYAKLDVRSRAAATLFATQHGLVGSFEPSGQG